MKISVYNNLSENILKNLATSMLYKKKIKRTRNTSEDRGVANK